MNTRAQPRHVSTASPTGSSNLRAFVVDDDPLIVDVLTHHLTGAGYQVTGYQSTVAALNDVLTQKPDFVLVDIMMPELDGLEFCRRVRQHAGLAAIKLIVVTAKNYDFDRRQAVVVGANGYITKPIGSDFLPELQALLSPAAEIRYWGVRGTLPASGRNTLKYGGNTSCVTMSFGRDHMFIFDAGTGIRTLGADIMARGKRVSGHILISHPHWDHINAFPFFAPLYALGNEFEVVGAGHGDITMEKMIGDQMDSIYFPMTMREFGARVTFRDIGEQQFEAEGVKIRTLLLSHPGRCLGYRIDTANRAFCYVTDNELFPNDLPQYDPHYRKRLIDFVKDADVLITDATFSDEMYRKRIGWGHSAVSEVAHLAHDAGVKELHLFHHEPDQTDDAIDDKLKQAQNRLAALGSSTRCVAPAEGDIVSVALEPGLAAKPRVPIY
ncbi:MAG TPA: response regulator [Magnetospirillaceae bacterium]|jgi:phosphoribosyl 1,2-cyclic phosphodiesterase